MRTRFPLWTSLSILFLLMAFISSGLAQEETCEPLLQTAFEQLNANCAALPGSAACFGSGASVTGEGDAGDGFSQPGDQLPLSEILGVQTLPQDEAFPALLISTSMDFHSPGKESNAFFTASWSRTSNVTV